MPASISSWTVARCPTEPAPGVADVILPGLALARVIRSATVEASKFLRSTNVRTRCQQGDRNPTRGVIAHLLVEKGVGRDRARRGQEQRVAIRACARDLGRTDIARRAADILHDRRLTPFAAELVGE